MSVMRLMLMCALTSGVAASASLPFYTFNEKSSLLLFLRPDNPSRYIGYRIVEEEPITGPEPVKGYEGMPERARPSPPPPVPDQIFRDADIPRGPYSETWMATFQDQTFSFRFGRDGTAYFRYVDQDGTRVSVFKAVGDGIDTWMWLEPTRDVAGSFRVQQCLRYSGAGNTDKRHRSAFVPELSEYDLWDRSDMRSLSYVRQGDAWRRIDPVLSYAEQSGIRQAWEYISTISSESDYVRRNSFFTPVGASLSEKAGVAVGPRQRIPHGLIVRESVDGTTVSGMYWERTTDVSTHHPADCLHSMVDLGPTSAAKPRVVRGKIYWFKGTKDDLLRHWERDFSK